MPCATGDGCDGSNIGLPMPQDLASDTNAWTARTKFRVAGPSSCDSPPCHHPACCRDESFTKGPYFQFLGALFNALAATLGSLSVYLS